MNFRHRSAILVLLAGAVSLAAQTLTSNAVTAAAGQNANFAGTGLAAVTKVELQQDGKPAVTANIVNRADNSLTIAVPAGTAAGSYSVNLTPGGNQNQTRLTVTAAPAAQPPGGASGPATGAPPAGSSATASPATPIPVIDSVFPASPFPTGNNRFSFEINGRNLAPDPIVNIEGTGDIHFVHREAPDGCKPYLTNLADLPCLEVSPEGRWLSIFGYERRYAYQGPIRVRVQVGNAASEPKAFTLSRVDHRIVVWLTFVAFGLLAYIVYRLVARGIKPYVIAGERYSPLAAFLLDKETDSYSLSKFQLLAFSSVMFFAYIYVFLCRTLVQWEFGFPDIPENYPALLAISAGTTAAATGLGSLRGTKGGGPVLPSTADLISNGGMVAADRFQFFVWTVIACLGFVALILMQDPSTVKEFPSFPNGLLYVMGVSAAGYLGGKAARNPGPILKQVTVSAQGQDLKVTLLGSNLDKKASFRIDGTEQATVTPAPAGGAAAAPAITGTAQPGAPNDYCSQLDFVLLRAAGFAVGDHVFEVINADGLGAQAQFTGNPMVITVPAAHLGTGNAPVPVQLTILNYRPNSTARWQAPGKTDAQDVPPPVFDAANNRVTVTLIPGNQAGAGTLTFTTPKGATETCSLMV